MWPDRRLLDLIGIERPVIQAPLAGANGSAMAIAASEAGGLGSLPCAMLDAAKVRAEIGVIRQRTTKPLNVNFFCHTPPGPDPDRDAAWKERLAAYYAELGLDPSASAPLQPFGFDTLNASFWIMKQPPQRPRNAKLLGRSKGVEAMWPDRRLLDLIGIELPVIQAPLAGGNGPAMAIAASEAGGLGSLPCGMLDTTKARAEIGIIRQRTRKPLNVNFFSHTPPRPDPDRDARWRQRLAAYYTELGLDASASAPAVTRALYRLAGMS